jgi:hypothetical protein
MIDSYATLEQELRDAASCFTLAKCCATDARHSGCNSALKTQRPYDLKPPTAP